MYMIYMILSVVAIWNLLSSHLNIHAHWRKFHNLHLPLEQTFWTMTYYKGVAQLVLQFYPPLWCKYVYNIV